MKTHLSITTGLLAVGLAAAVVAAQEQTIYDGSLQFTIDDDAWAELGPPSSPGTTDRPLLDFIRGFTGAEASALGRDALLDTDWDPQRPIPAFPAYSPDFNPDDAGLFTQGSTFRYTPGDVLGTESGFLGIAGVLDFDFDDLATPDDENFVFVLGDFRLSYEETGRPATRSGWFLQQDFDFNSPVFDTTNVTVVDTQTELSISGDLVIAPEILVFLQQFDPDRVMGTFSFTGTPTAVIPEPATLGLVAAGGLALLRRRR